MFPQPSDAPDRIANPWGERTPHGAGAPWPVRVDQQLAHGVDEADVERWVKSASVLHSNGDALDLAVARGRIVGVRGRGEDRVNHGRLGPKDLYGWQAMGSPDRLTTPLVRRDGELVPATWDEAMGLLAERSRALLAERGPGALAHYTTGQLFLEEYYTLQLMWKAGLGSNHLDGNTRLCTATAGEALKESFGCDGQPGSYSDVDHCDAIALWGHNVAETQTVLWARMLDRRRGADPPRLLCVDPRSTPVAQEADVHLAIRPGTNLALMNAVLHELIARDNVDHAYVEAHTIGYDDLVAQVEGCTPEWAAPICGLEPAEIRAAVDLLAGAERLLSTVLQGFYQANQATASAVQVNNLHLVRGMLGRPGAGVLQMNGQPTAQNTRETGADGDLPAFRNWANPAHTAELAKLWNVEPASFPTYAPPTHAMELYRQCEKGTIKLLWISATNPAVSLPELHRIRAILAQEELFVVVQDLFLTETAALADVVLPAATQGEKTGCFTNVDRTVHLSEQAVEPPGEAKADLDIFLDYARRMGFCDRDGAPLVKWQDASGAFDAWAACTRGRPCDYTGLSHDRLRTAPSGIQWPCNEEHPNGAERLYTRGSFPAQPDECETYGRDLVTGAAEEAEEYRSYNPGGKAMIKAAEFFAPAETPGGEYPFALITGRTAYHFHTRTKTARAPELHAAAPDVWVELHRDDAVRLGLDEGERVAVISPRGRMEGPLRLTDARPSTVFVPFHYGYWDTRPGATDPGDRPRGANEMTITEWDPLSKQPIFKTAACRVQRVAT